jgi:rubrerythrin
MRRSTREWLFYFRANQAEPTEIPWEEMRPLEPGVRPWLVPSLQQFQLGESGTGTSFLERARLTGDLDFVEALALFIAEEQRHSGMLARYLRAQGEPLLPRDAVASFFRRLRKMAGLELMVRTLVTAEVIAMPYYRAVARVTGCAVLRAICRRVLWEEAQHLAFQASTLQRLAERRFPGTRWLVKGANRILLAGTCVVVWRDHGAVLRAGGFPFLSFVESCFRHLRHVERLSRPGEMPAVESRAIAAG